MTLRVFSQAMAAIEGRGESFSREFLQWLRGIVFVLNVGPVPPKGIVWANISAADIAAYFTGGLGNTGEAYEGWAICDGNNGTPNLSDRFVRAKVTGAGATGGADTMAHTHAIDHDHAAFTSATESGHTHAIDHDHASFTSATESGHTHAIDHDHASFTSGASSGHTHSTPNHQHQTDIGWDSAGPKLYMRQDGSGNPLSGSITESAVTGATATISAPGSISVRLAQTRNDGSGTTGAESGHTHTVDPPALTGTSGASSGHTHSIDPPALTGTSGASSGHTHSIDVPAISATSGAASNTENRPAYFELVPLMRVWT